MRGSAGRSAEGDDALGRDGKTDELRGSAFRAGVPRERTPLRDNLESIAVVVLMVLLVRQVVVEAFRIRHGSMAPTLVGFHQEVRCPDCAWVFHVGQDKVGPDGEVECPNCRYHWQGGSRYDSRGGPIAFRRPSWLWNVGETTGGTVLRNTDAANRVHRGAARIFVNKFLYRLRKPRRWEVIVFISRYSVRCRTCDWTDELESNDLVRCPECGSSDLNVTARDFIKRVVGLPNETVSLQDGDVHINGRIARKPRDVQKRLWFHVFDSRFMPRRKMPPPEQPFAHPSLQWRRLSEGGVLSVDARGAAAPVMAWFAPRVVDFYPYDGLSYQRAAHRIGAAGRNQVGDCRIRAQVRVLDHEQGGGEVVLAIDDAGHSFTLSVGTGAHGTATLKDDTTVLRKTSVGALKPHESIWLTLENYDDRVVARVGRKEILSYDYQGLPVHRHAVRFGARGAKVLWERIIVERDIYYTDLHAGSGGPAPYELGDGKYFVLGDNSPASSDSRRWDDPGVPEKNLIGKAFFVFWPIHYMKRL